MARIRHDAPYDDVQKEELETVGPLLFGRLWAPQMAELIGENPRYVNRCLDVPCAARLLDEHRERIRKALVQRQRDIDKALKMMDRHTAQADDWAA